MVDIMLNLLDKLFMQNGDDFWLIDMALAENSAGYDKYVQPSDRKPSPEKWIPCIK